MNKITWTNEKRKVSELSFADYNPRQMTEKQAEDLKTSIERFDLADPIVINTTNRIIGGHMRIKILQQQGIEEVDVRVPDRELNEAEEKELNIRLNKNLGEWDWDLLANFEIDFLKDVGFDKDLEKIMGNSENEKPEIEFGKELLLEHNYVVLYFDNVLDWQTAVEKLNLKQVKNLLPGKSQSVGIGRVIKGKDIIEKL